MGPYTDSGSLNRGDRGQTSSKAFSTYYAGADNRTISEFGGRKRGKKGTMLTSKASESNFGNDQFGQMLPPKIGRKKIRPFSAPRHQGLRSQGLKQKVAGYQMPNGQPT